MERGGEEKIRVTRKEKQEKGTDHPMGSGKTE